MATYSSTISNTLLVIGMAKTYNWDEHNWDEFLWTASIEDLEIIFTKHISENISLTDSINKLVTKVISEGISVDDTLFKQVVKGLSEAINADDTLYKQVQKGLSEGLNLNDIVYRTLYRLISNSITTDQDEIIYHQRGPWNYLKGDIHDMSKVEVIDWSSITATAPTWSTIAVTATSWSET